MKMMELRWYGLGARDERLKAELLTPCSLAGNSRYDNVSEVRYLGGSI